MRLKKCDCLLCSFENPKVTVNAIIIKDQKILLGKRKLKDEPFYGKWDVFGGFLQKGETPEKALLREVKEELGVGCKGYTFMGSFTGTSFYKGYKFPVTNLSYLVELDGEPKLNDDENSDIAWRELKTLRTVAFDSNQKVLKFLKQKFVWDFVKIKKLIFQLDPNAVADEQNIYKAMLNGYVSKIEKEGKLVGLGWIFPRQTLLRKQAVVEDMIVDEKYRGKGYGENILLDLIRWAKSQGVEVVELTTNPRRVAANSLYKKIGFKLHETNHYLLNLKK